MGTEGIKLIGMDVKLLINELNKALADEWLAYYQYWVGSKIAVGVMRTSVVEELEEHAKEEKEHADMLADRIVQLGGTPVIDPTKWIALTNCGYETPSDPSTIVLLEQNIKGEQCAIRTYRKILDMVQGKDSITFNMIRKIMQDEVDHEDELEAIMDDIEKMKEQLSRS
ncbi:MAG TPA: ferritin [archaeon]|nr:ferritin [archaeon]